jgi:molybdopterin-containing oxidoreductase family iron-sulfur binding subunit
MVFALNHSLQNIGKTLFYRQRKDECFDNLDELLALIEDINSSKINSLVLVGGNPLYNMPVDLGFKHAIQKVTHTIHCSLYFNETSQQVEWHVPQTHFLEAWGDARANDGTASVIQPLIAPLFDGHSDIELLNLILTSNEAEGYDITRETWTELLPQKKFEKHWRRVLHDGVLENSRSNFTIPQLRSSSLVTYLKANPLTTEPISLENMELIFQASPKVHDGRFANNGWLQELPDTVTKLAWDNAAILSPETASALGVKNEDLIILNIEGRELPVPVWILPGQVDFSISIALGYGRSAAGRIGNGVGFNAYRLRMSETSYVATGLSIRKTRDRYKFANTQDHNSMEGRPFVRESDLIEFKKNPDFAREMVKHPPLISLWDEHSYEQGYQWGMSIDLNACIGCNACTIACQSENNIPIVGKEQVIEGREMHWIRVDRYFSGAIDTSEMVYQPVACQHCENAPCEQVCPVAATVHDSEGLNVMTYNRCIGTRYCSNNCPYKVRRFNFFNYTKDLPEIVQMGQNPDVTVRSRGVMEKCTYCVQRISEAKIKAKNEGRALRDGDVVTACQQACPTNAITFGDINNPESQIVKMKKESRSYEILAELNIKPRTSYLAKLRNPHPELKDT